MIAYEADRDYPVRIMPSAARALREIRRYVADVAGDPVAAARTVGRILSDMDSLGRLPRRRSVLAADPLTGLELRSLPSGGYSILYVVAGGEVRVLSVLASCADIESRIAGIFDCLVSID